MLLATTYKKKKKINWHKEQGKLLLTLRPQKGRIQGCIGPEAPALPLCHALCRVLLYGGQTSLQLPNGLGSLIPHKHVSNIQKRAFLQVALC